MFNGIILFIPRVILTCLFYIKFVVVYVVYNEIHRNWHKTTTQDILNLMTFIIKLFVSNVRIYM